MSTITKNAIQSGNPPIRPLPFDANQPETIRLYPLSNYTFGVKETQPEEDPSVVARLRRLEEHYAEHGMRRTCEGILVCHEHNHPHILMLQIANAFFKLPGDYLRPEDDELGGFKTRLDERLAPVGRLGEGEEAGDWEVGECLAQWWRPNFETFMYPFIPAHVTRPKECKKLYFIQLPKSSECTEKLRSSCESCEQKMTSSDSCELLLLLRKSERSQEKERESERSEAKAKIRRAKRGTKANKLDRSTQRPEEHEAAGCSIVRALRQHRAVRPPAVSYPPPVEPLQL